MPESVKIPECIHAGAVNFRETAALLYEMAGIYPGDIDGTISREAFALGVMAELIEDADWQEIMRDYDDNRPQITITMHDRNGNEIVS